MNDFSDVNVDLSSSFVSLINTLRNKVNEIRNNVILYEHTGHYINPTEYNYIHNKTIDNGALKLKEDTIFNKNQREQENINAYSIDSINNTASKNKYSYNEINHNKNLKENYFYAVYLNTINKEIQNGENVSAATRSNYSKSDILTMDDNDIEIDVDEKIYIIIEDMVKIIEETNQYKLTTIINNTNEIISTFNYDSNDDDNIKLNNEFHVYNINSIGNKHINKESNDIYYKKGIKKNLITKKSSIIDLTEESQDIIDELSLTYSDNIHELNNDKKIGDISKNVKHEDEFNLSQENRKNKEIFKCLDTSKEDEISKRKPETEKIEDEMKNVFSQEDKKFLQGEEFPEEKKKSSQANEKICSEKKAHKFNVRKKYLENVKENFDNVFELSYDGFAKIRKRKIYLDVKNSIDINENNIIFSNEEDNENNMTINKYYIKSLDNNENNFGKYLDSHRELKRDREISFDCEIWDNDKNEFVQPQVKEFHKNLSKSGIGIKVGLSRKAKTRALHKFV